MSLYAGVLASQREKECAAELGTPGAKFCRLPTCLKQLRRDNETGFCRDCQCSGPGRRWYRMLIRPDRIEHDKAVFFRWRTERFAKGLCANCTGQRVPPGKRCAACIVSDRAASAALRAARTLRGICWYCASDAAPGKRRCRKHLAIDAARTAKRRKSAARADRARVRELLAAVAA